MRASPTEDGQRYLQRDKNLQKTLVGMAHQPVLSSLTQGVPLPFGSRLVPKISQIKNHSCFTLLNKNKSYQGQEGNLSLPSTSSSHYPAGQLSLAGLGN